MKALGLSIAVGCIGLVAEPAGGAVLYRVVDLGTVGDSFRSEARGISSSGLIYGESFNTYFPYFTWEPPTNTGIAKPAGVASMSISAMNDLGQFVGLFSYFSKPTQAFFGTPSAALILTTNFSPNGLNIHGVVAGVTTIHLESPPGSGIYYYVSRPAYVVNQLNLTRLPTLNGDGAPYDAEATAINDAGAVIGWSGTSNNVKHAFLWDGTMHDLHTLSTPTNSVAVAVNKNGVVAGYMYTFSNFRSPFVWTPSNGMAALNLPAGYNTGQPLGMNNRGDIVGLADNSAVIWTNGVMTDLQTVIPTSPLWDLDAAYGINDSGYIVGYGKLGGGLTKGFLLVPTNVPAPQFTIELLDPSPAATNGVFTGTTLTTNTAILNSLDVHRVGVAADGASRLLVRVSTTNQGTVSLSLIAADGAGGVTGNQDEDGGVGNIGGHFSLPLGYYDTPTQNTPQGIRAYAVYHAPDIFHRSGSNDSILPQRIIAMQAVFTPNTGLSVTQSVAIAIVRPPIVVMHGIWSDRPQSFGAFEQAFLMDEHAARIFGRSYSNAVSFHSNSNVVLDEIANGCRAIRAARFACTRADIFSHSMGGVLSRIHAGEATYHRPENYWLGDIHRLVTIDSPHKGSFVADDLDAMFTWLSQNNLGDKRAYIIAEMTRRGMPPDLGAGYDLMSHSAEIIKMNQRPTDVAAHVIVGDYTVGVTLTELPEPLGGFYRLLDYFSGLNLATLFFSPIPDTDLVVDVSSQYAGLEGMNSASVFNHPHSGAATQAVVIAECLSLYERPPSSSRYAKGFPTGWTPPPPVSLPPPPGSVGSLINDILDLVFPGGTVWYSGQSVNASVSQPPGTNFTSVLLLARGLSSQVTNAPFDFTFTIPNDFIGDFPVSYVARDTQSNTWYGTRTLTVSAPSYLYDFSVEPTRFDFTRLGAQRPLTVTGLFNDGIYRNITDPVAGTSYVSGNTNVVSVHPYGVMTAVGNGATQITVSNYYKTYSIDAAVSLEPSPDLALTQTVASDRIGLGAPVTFTLRVTNNGPDVATSVYLADMLPDSAQFIAATASQGAWYYTNGQFTAQLGTVASGASATLTLTLSFSSSGAHTNEATVAGVGIDANSADNIAAASVVVLPVLGIRRESSNVVLFWPTNVPDLTLEFTTNLNAATWLSNPPPPIIVNGQNTVTNSLTSFEKYFRLRK